MTAVLSHNPATGDSVALPVEETLPEQVRTLCAQSRIAADWYATQSLERRAILLETMATMLEEDAEILIQTAMRETALPQARLEGELRRTAFQFRFFAQVVRDGMFLQASIDHAGDSPMGPLPDLRRMRVALGPVAVFGSSNFPFAFSVPGGDTASALAAGCPVVIKAHPAHPATSLAAFDSLWRGARTWGAPDGLLGLIFGVEAGVALVEDPDISAVGFTGSVDAGVALWQRANSRAIPIPFYGELGSANPLVVSSAASQERAGEIGAGIAASMTLGVGQFCTKPGLLLVPVGPDGDELVESLSTSLREINAMTMLSENIAQHFRHGLDVMSHIEGVRQLVGSGDDGGANASAHLFEVASATFMNDAAAPLRHECFGPVAIVVRYETYGDLESVVNRLEPALTFSVFLADDDPEGSALLALGPKRAGRVLVNQYPTGVGVSWSMQHGGPWPATTSPSSTSVGAAGIDRWLRPVTWQGVPRDLLPPELRDDNPLTVPQRVDGELHPST